MRQLTGVYKFEQFTNSEGLIELTDPILEVDPVVKNVNPINNTISAKIYLIVENGRYSVLLTNIAVVDLNYNADELLDRVVEKLNEFKQ